MKTKNGHILTFSEKMQISAILCFATCDWFCPMTSHIFKLSQDKDGAASFCKRVQTNKLDGESENAPDRGNSTWTTGLMGFL